MRGATIEEVPSARPLGVGAPRPPLTVLSPPVPCPWCGAEVKLTMYSMESCAAAVLQLRVPHVHQRQLAAWFQQGPAGARKSGCT